MPGAASIEAARGSTAMIYLIVKLVRRLKSRREAQPTASGR
jgi:hypothetical protein